MSILPHPNKINSFLYDVCFPFGKNKRATKLHRNEWPPFMRKENALTAIYVGGCIFNKHWPNEHAAHAHYKLGIICIPSMSCLFTPMVMEHELAHILTGGGHTKKWAQKFIELGASPYDVIGHMYPEYDVISRCDTSKSRQQLINWGLLDGTGWMVWKK